MNDTDSSVTHPYLYLALNADNIIYITTFNARH